MARRYRKSRRVSQRQYRARKAKYELYKAKTLDPVSFREWNEPYRQTQFLKKEYKIGNREAKRYNEVLTEPQRDYIRKRWADYIAYIKSK